jgi:hypothetical protein
MSLATGLDYAIQNSKCKIQTAPACGAYANVAATFTLPLRIIAVFAFCITIAKCRPSP